MLWFHPIATAEAVLTDDEKEAGVVLVDIGGGGNQGSHLF